MNIDADAPALVQKVSSHWRSAANAQLPGLSRTVVHENCHFDVCLREWLSRNHGEVVDGLPDRHIRRTEVEFRRAELHKVPPEIQGLTTIRATHCEMSGHGRILFRIRNASRDINSVFNRQMIHTSSQQWTGIVQGIKSHPGGPSI